MKLVLTALTPKGEEHIKVFVKNSKNFLIKRYVKLKVAVVSDKPYIIVCESNVFQGDASKVKINTVYEKLKMFWFMDLEPKKDYKAEVVQ